MENTVRSPVLGEQVPLWAIVGLAVLGVWSALLTARALGEQAASPEPSTKKAVDSTPHVAEVEESVQAPGLDVEPAPPALPPADEATPPPDCPELPRFAFRTGYSKPIDKLDDEVEALVRWMERHPEAVLIVEGHADATGGPKLNLGLSFDRARAVSKLFIARGLPAQRIDVEAYGAFRPIERQGGSSAVDRRVTLRTEGQPVCPHQGGNQP